MKYIKIVHAKTPSDNVSNLPPDSNGRRDEHEAGRGRERIVVDAILLIAPLLHSICSSGMI